MEHTHKNHILIFYYNRDRDGYRGQPHSKADNTWYPARPGQIAEVSDFNFDANGNFSVNGYHDPALDIHNERAKKYYHTNDYNKDGTPKIGMIGDTEWVVRQMKTELATKVLNKKTK